jgi:hypothetical protein
MELIFVEQKKRRLVKLQRVPDEEASDVAYKVWHGTVDEHLDAASA